MARERKPTRSAGTSLDQRRSIRSSQPLVATTGSRLDDRDAALPGRVLLTVCRGIDVMSSRTYAVREVIVPARPVAGARARVPRGRVGQEFAKHLNQVYDAARRGVVALDGQNVFIYRAATADELTVDFCVGVTAPFTAQGNVEPLSTPSGMAAMTVHQGDYGRLGDAIAAIHAWCRANDRSRAGPSWEVYGHWHDDPALLTTEVYYLLRPGGAAGGS